MFFYIIYKKQKVEECKMKNLRKKLWTMVSVAMLGIAVVGCGGPKASPAESVTIFLDAVCRGEDSKIESIGGSKEEVKEIRDEMVKEAESRADQLGVEMDDETKGLVVESAFALLERIEYTAETKSEDGDKAVVEVSFKAIDIEKIHEELAKEMETYIAENADLGENELLKYMFKKQTELIKSVPLKEAQTTTISVTKKGNSWEADEESFNSFVRQAMGQ